MTGFHRSASVRICSGDRQPVTSAAADKQIHRQSDITAAESGRPADPLS